MGMLSLLNAAEAIIQAKIDDSSTDLGDIKVIHKGGAISPRPFPEFPLIIIGADKEDRQHKRAARVSGLPLPSGFGERYRWFIAVCHSTGDLTESFEKVCNIWEELKPTVDDNFTWGSSVHDTDYDGSIEYGAINPFGVEESKLTYTILIKLVSFVGWGGER